MVLKAQIDTNTVVEEDLNTPLSPIDMSSSLKINKETSELLHSLDPIHMVGIYRVFQPTTRQYTFFSEAYGTFSKVDHILGHKASLNKFKKIKLIPCITSDQNGITLNLNNKRKPRKYSNRD
jgi:exonuclease III